MMLNNAHIFLKKSGLKITKHRKIILDILQKNLIGCHVSAEDIYLHLKNSNMKIGIASIYRTLSSFTEIGLTNRSCFVSGKTYFELASDSGWHIHLINELTGEIIEIRDSGLQKQLSDLLKQKGYQVSEQGMTVYVHPQQ